MTDTVHATTAGVLIAPGLTLAVQQLLRRRPVDDLTAIAKAAGVLREVDHAVCEGPDCDRIICCCEHDLLCTGTVAQACSHHLLLCRDCSLAECRDCRADYSAAVWGGRR